MSTLKVNNITAVTGSTVTADKAIVITDNTSSTSTSTGALKVTGGISTQENLYVGGNAVITGTMTANGGTLTLGNANSDNLSILAELTSDVIPDATNTYDLGSATKKWAEIHATTVYGDGSNLTGISSDLTVAGDSGSDTVTVGTDTFTITGGTNLTSSMALNELTLSLDASPDLTGTPTAPTAAASTNTTQIATTAFVATEVANLVDAAPGAMDTLNELAAALGDDANYAASTTSALNARLELAGGTMTGNIAMGGSDISGAGTVEASVVDIDSVATLDTATVTSLGTSISDMDTFSATSYRSAKYLVSIKDVTNSEYQSSEVLIVHDGSTSYLTEYGQLHTGVNPLVTFTTDISGGNVRLRGTGISANNNVKVIRTLVKA